MDTAIILAGGFGTRLRSVVSDVPKPLAPVAGRPFLSMQLDWLARHGISRAVITAHHLAQKIIDFANAVRETAPVRIDVVVEPEPLGTGGAVAHAFSAAGVEDDAVVLNGDTHYAFDLTLLADDHTARRGAVTMAVAAVEDSGRYGTVEVREGKVKSFRQATGAREPGLVSCGLYIFGRDALMMAPAGKFSMEHDFFPGLAAAGKLNACVIDGVEAFTDIGLPEAYAAFCARFS